MANGFLPVTRYPPSVRTAVAWGPWGVPVEDQSHWLDQALVRQFLPAFRIEVDVGEGLENVVVAQQLSDRVVRPGHPLHDFEGGAPVDSGAAEAGGNGQRQQSGPAQDLQFRERRLVGGVALEGIRTEDRSDLVCDVEPAGRVRGAV